MSLFRKPKQKKTDVREEKMTKLHARFLYLAQEIICDRNAALSVADSAVMRVRQLDQELNSEEQNILWMMKIFNEEIDFYFNNLKHQIINNSKHAEEKLYHILSNRFSKIVTNKFDNEKEFKEYFTKEDTEEIIQNALIIVHKKLSSSEPKGTFIQWAQMICKYTFLEYRKRKIKMMTRTVRIDQDDDKRTLKSLANLVTSRKKVKEHGEFTTNNISKLIQDHLEEDRFMWSPFEVEKARDIEKCLLSIVKHMAEPCKRIFHALFTYRTEKAVFAQFPDHRPDQLYVMISRCRTRLKEKASAEGIIL
jgi:hypothetical protein